MDDTQIRALRALVEPLLLEQQVEVVELTCRPAGGGLVLRFLIDKVGGVTLKDCARINQLLGEALDRSQVIEQSYTLEVSSPGLDRPLISVRDYERALGQDVRLQVRVADGRSRESEGQLLAVQPQAIVLKTPAGNVTIPLVEIQLATKVIRW